MATQINVTVGGGELPAQAKRGQEGNRWRLTERERSQQTTAQRQAAEQQRQAAQSTGADPNQALGRGPSFGYRPDELAAFRHGGTAFVVIVSYTNFGLEKQLELFLSTPIEGALQKQTGLMTIPTQFTAEDYIIEGQQGLKAAATKIRPVAQIYSEKGLTKEQFLATPAGVAVSEWIRTHTCWPEWQTNRTTQWNEAHTMRIGQSITSSNASKTSYRIALRQITAGAPVNVRILTGVTTQQGFSVQNDQFFYGYSAESVAQVGYQPGQVLIIDDNGGYDLSYWRDDLFNRQAWINQGQAAESTYVYYQGNYSCEFTP